MAMKQLVWEQNPRLPKDRITIFNRIRAIAELTYLANSDVSVYRRIIGRTHLKLPVDSEPIEGQKRPGEPVEQGKLNVETL